MTGWPLTRLGNIADRIQIGPFGSLLHKEDYSFDGIPIVNPMHIVGGNIKVDPRHAVTRETWHRLRGYQLKAGDVVLGRRGEMGRCAVVPDGAAYLCGTGSLFIRSGADTLSPDYLSRLLSSPPVVAQLERASLGTTMANLNQGIIADLVIPQPPIEEQRRIAAILDQVDALRTKRRQALSHLDDLTQAIFVEMFGDPANTTQSDWDVRKVADIADVQGGLTINSSRQANPIEVPYLRVANVHRQRLDISEIKTLRATRLEIERTKLEGSDLLVVEGHGNAAEIGRAALWDASIAVCVHQNHLIRIRFNTSVVLPGFGSAYINSDGGRQHLLRAGKTTSGLNTISVSDVRSTPIATPPISLQKRFVEQLDSIRSFKASQIRSGGHLDELFATLQSRAFAGEL